MPIPETADATEPAKPAGSSRPPEPTGPAGPPARPRGSGPAASLVARLPEPAQVLLVWAAATLLSLTVLRLGAADTPTTVWAQASPGWAEHIAFWDSGWYERIDREGYPAVLPTDDNGVVVQNAWAFMPMLPYLAAALGWTGWSFYTCASVVAIAASAGAALVSHWWLAPRTGRTASLWAVALTWSAPCAVVLQLPYAESLGLLLAGAALALAGRRSMVLAAPAAVLAAFARPIGVPLTAALGLWWLWDLACARGWVPPGWHRRLLPGQEPLDTPSRRGLLALTVASGAAALAWPAIAWAVTGRADAYTATETAWRYGSLAPFVPWFTRSQWWVGDHLGALLLLGVLAVAVLALTAPSLRRLGAPAWFWCVGYTLYLLAFFDPTTSVFRILIPLTPVAWALAASATTRRRAALLVACVVGQLFWVSWLWDLGSVSITWVP